MLCNSSTLVCDAEGDLVRV